MSYEIDADALIDRLIDRLVEAEKRNAGASYIEAMQKYELLRIEYEQETRARAALQNKIETDKPKLKALWVAAEMMVRVARDKGMYGVITKDSVYVEALDKGLKEACEACDGDDIPF